MCTNVLTSLFHSQMLWMTLVYLPTSQDCVVAHRYKKHQGRAVECLQ